MLRPVCVRASPPPLSLSPSFRPCRGASSRCICRCTVPPRPGYGVWRPRLCPYFLFTGRARDERTLERAKLRWLRARAPHTLTDVAQGVCHEALSAALKDVVGTQATQLTRTKADLFFRLPVFIAVPAMTRSCRGRGGKDQQSGRHKAQVGQAVDKALRVRTQRWSQCACPPAQRRGDGRRRRCCGKRSRARQHARHRWRRRGRC